MKVVRLGTGVIAGLALVVIAVSMGIVLLADEERDAPSRRAQVLREIGEDTALGRVTAIAWDGRAVFVGTPFGVTRVEASGARRVLRPDVHVTSLAFDEKRRRLYVGTHDEGVLVLDDNGHERRVGQGRVRELRLVGDRAIAVTDHGTVDVESGDAWPEG